MKEKIEKPFYDPNKSYEENYKQGPFGAFAHGEIYQQVGEPPYDYHGHPVYLPFGIPAGPLVNSNFIKAAFAKGFDICVYKTVRSKSYPCAPWPNVLSVKIEDSLTLERAEQGLVADNQYHQPLSITNSFGVPSFDPDIWQPDMKKAIDAAGKGQILVGSFQGTTLPDRSADDYISDFATTARLVKETGAKILEVNLSCPNEGTGHLLCFDRERTHKVVEAIKNEIGNTPLIIKIAYFETDEQLEKLIKPIGAAIQGIAAINTIPAKILDKEGKQALPGKGRERSGVCGHTIKWAGIEMVERLKKLREENDFSFSIDGVGGVTAPEDFEDYRNAGADAVMSATGAMWNPYLAQEIKNGRK